MIPMLWPDRCFFYADRDPSNLLDPLSPTNLPDTKEEPWFVLSQKYEGVCKLLYVCMYIYMYIVYINIYIYIYLIIYA